MEDSTTSSNNSTKIENSEVAEVVTGNTWWGSWINSAKEKTSTVFEAVKNDLDELSNVIRNEASNVGAALESSLKFDENTSSVGTVKKSLSSFFGQVTEALIPSLEDDETETILITHDGLITLSGFPKHLAELQNNDKTYVEQPEPELAQKYKRWMEVVEQDQFTQDRLARHLTNSEILNDKYITLVPDKVTHMDFWQRYLFKRALLEDAIANAELAEKRSKTEIHSDKPSSPKKNIIQTEQPKLSLKEEEEDEVDDTTPVVVENKISDEEVEDLENELLNNDITCSYELSEEEQIRLLEEYELEIQEREKTKPITEVEKEKVNTKTSVTKQAKPAAKNLTEKKNSKQLSTESTKKMNKPATITNNKNSTQKTDKTQKNTNKGKIQNIQQKQQSTETAQKAQKEKEENSSTSDESWEKDFDLNE